jgi:RNA polymerase sigma factor (sigma-70 family)
VSITNRVDPRASAGQIYAVNRSRLLAIAKRNCGSDEEAEEALQDAFVLFIDRFDPGSGARPLAWLTLTLKRRCWALHRRRRDPRLVAIRSEDGGAGAMTESAGEISRSPEELAELREAIAALLAAFTRLKPQERQALGLLALGYSYREICARTDWTYTKVNRCITEGRASLRRASGSDPLGPA